MKGRLSPENPWNAEVQRLKDELADMEAAVRWQLERIENAHNAGVIWDVEAWSTDGCE